MTPIRDSLSTGRWDRVTVFRRDDELSIWPFVVKGYDAQGPLILGEFRTEKEAVRRYQEACNTE